MSSNDPQSGAAELRAQAETLIRGKAAQSPEHLATLSPEVTRAMLHELQVHQIELELQNEELRRAQVALEESRARYYDLYDLAPVAYVTVSKPGLILEANLTTCTLLGLARSALVGQPFSRFILREDQDPYYLFRQRLFETGEPQVGEIRLAKLDGPPCWVHLAAITARDEGGAPVCRMTLSDITERKQAEETLRNRDARHSKMIANIGDVIVIIDREGINRYKSPNVEKLFGWRAEELVGVDALDKVHPDDLDSTRKVLGGLLGEPNVIRTTELRYRRKDGRYCWIEFTGVNLSHDPDIRGLLGNYRDITERKQAEELHLQTQKTESLGRMAGAIAHHFNNKLQTVMLRLKIETTSQLQNPALVESLGQILQSTLEAAEVSTLLLTYLGQSQVSHKPLDLAEECRASLPRLRVAMPTNVDLETDLPSPGPVISANANQIQQVLTNLMTNAWETKSEGPNHIRLGVKSVTAADISQRRRFPLDYQTQETDYACLEVTDAGGGIAAQASERLFDPFFSTKFNGRGLGLPVVLGIVRSHHGVVTVESEPGRGSIFRCFFPVTAEAARPKLLPVPVGPGSENVRRGNTVLVVEDEESLRETLALTLELNDHTVLTAKDGVAAVEIFRQHQDEIGGVLCDVNMPRMNGWETLMALRKLVPDLPVILLSGYSDDQVLAADHPERPQAFLHKPCEVQVLLNAINQMMAKKKE